MSGAGPAEFRHLIARLLALDEAGALGLNRLTRRSRHGQTVAGLAAGGLAGGEVLLMLVLVLRGHWRTALRMLFAVGSVYVAVELAGVLLRRQRPFAQIGEIEELLRHRGERSFPSRHVASAVAMAVIGRPTNPTIGRLMAVGAWLLGVSRIAAGLHYPSDVIAGAVLGLFFGRYIVSRTDFTDTV